MSELPAGRRERFTAHKSRCQILYSLLTVVFLNACQFASFVSADDTAAEKDKAHFGDDSRGFETALRHADLPDEILKVFQRLFFLILIVPNRLRGSYPSFFE